VNSIHFRTYVSVQIIFFSHSKNQPHQSIDNHTLKHIQWVCDFLCSGEAGHYMWQLWLLESNHWKRERAWWMFSLFFIDLGYLDSVPRWDILGWARNETPITDRRKVYAVHSYTGSLYNNILAYYVLNYVQYILYTELCKY